MLVVFNPAAGRRRAQLLWRVVDIMSSSGVRVEIAETTGAGHATALAMTAAMAGERMVVAAGGDGTIAEVANGLAGSSCLLGVIPLGTANVLAHELALPTEPRAVAAALAFARTRRIWPGLIHGDPPCGWASRSFSDAPGGKPDRLFVQMVGAGFDAQVVHRLPPRLKRALGPAAYVLQGLREVARYDFAPIALEIDGHPLSAGSVIVTKGHYYAGRHPLVAEASPSAPGLTVALFERCGPWSALMYGVALTADLLPRMPGLRVMRARDVVIVSGVPAQADGDPAGLAPLHLSDAPAPIEIVVG